MFNDQRVQQISFAVPTVVFTNLAKRAGPLNIKPTEYARRLFEAAYAARVAGERGQQTEDAALDHQVRQVFLLADCEPEFIAEALLLPLERVQRMLEGWRQVARDLVDPPAKAEKPAETKAPPPPPAEPMKTGAMEAGEISVIRALWREGKTVAAIADTLGRAHKSVANFAMRNRDICPPRKADK
ncbi:MULTISPECIES: helix-turn-helix domain-containing protein [unclassified Mesorhizobium]|uniref:helix-turn-helix domain-containing protein n=1 Tax=unclassified Mesorhizobium TaxID=325217 RepID=UPI00112CBFFA|nr:MULTISPECIES: helix-turn-helix domain-containing protein [unclassified Mesorhizobium]TPM06782.1 helix-turn-helix domain-containing protein [Mesorhizobium sp. B2-3-8]TPM15335.1 helix-turn-helix domain-containing protein [Mesorhizobium sp. B2-3-7]